MKTIAVITSTRADFGLLLPVIKKLRENDNSYLRTELIVTGTHLLNEYGNTVDEIEKTGIGIDERICIPLKSRSGVDISNNQAIILRSFSELFYSKNYAGIVILGDRYEMLAVAIAASNVRIPIFHLSGGDTTEGAIDEWIRHSITKMSYMHFTTNSDSFRRVIQMGENPKRVFNVGSTSIDNILKLPLLEKREILSSLGLKDCKYSVCTYHPVTMNYENVDDDINEFLRAIDYYKDIQFIVTKSNADQGGAHINELLDKAECLRDNMYVFASLGAERYLSLIKNAEFVLGNSSSGIVEAPAFGIPTVNIGDRQRGRLQSESIINCSSDSESIIKAIDKALTVEFKEICKHVISPYGDGQAAKRIADKIIEVINEDRIDLKKSFYNIEECK